MRFASSVQLERKSTLKARLQNPPIFISECCCTNGPAELPHFRALQLPSQRSLCAWPMQSTSHCSNELTSAISTHIHTHTSAAQATRENLRRIRSSAFNALCSASTINASVFVPSPALYTRRLVTSMRRHGRQCRALLLPRYIAWDMALELRWLAANIIMVKNL